MLLAAAGIGIGHAILPDHWMPLAVVARTRRYPLRRVLRLSSAAAVTHVLVSLLAGAVLIAVGTGLRDTVAHHTDLVVGAILLATGLVLVALEIFGRSHGHSHAHDHDDSHGHDHSHSHDPVGDGHPHPHPHTHPHPTSSAPALAVLDRPIATAQPAPAEPSGRRLLAFLVPFGAAASPDLTILPLFLAAGAVGVAPALGVFAVFAASTIAAIVGLTTATALGAARLTAPWIEKRANALTALTLIVIGALVMIGVI